MKPIQQHRHFTTDVNRVLKGNRQIRRRFGTLLASVCAVLLCSCSTLTPTQIATLVDLAMNAAQVGIGIWLKENPTHREAVVHVVSALDEESVRSSLIPGPSAEQLLASLPMPTLSGDAAELHFRTNLVVWDKRQKKLMPVKGEAREPVLRAVRQGMRRALAPITAMPPAMPLRSQAIRAAGASPRQKKRALPPVPAGLLLSPSSTNSVPVTEPPITEPPGPLRIEYRLDWDFFGCAGMPGCVLYDETHLFYEQKAGTELSLYVADAVNAMEWSHLAWFGAGTTDRTSQWAQFLPANQRGTCRFFKGVASIPTTERRATSKPVIWLNPKFKGARAWSRNSQVVSDAVLDAEFAKRTNVVRRVKR